MKNFWTFYQNIETVEHPFRAFGFDHLAYVVLTFAAIFLLMKAYQKRDKAGQEKWLKGVALFLFLQEIFYYSWIYIGCRTDPLFEVLHLELCTFCLFVDFSCMFHQNKQARYYGAVVGLIGAPIAIAYPATVTELYPAFCYRIIGFYLSHGAIVLFSLMALSDLELMTKQRMKKNIAILACTLAAVYFFDLKFGTQYMFVGTPPEIGIIRMVYDLVGQMAFLPTAIVIFSAYQVLMHFVVKKIQRRIYSGKVTKM